MNPVQLLAIRQLLFFSVEEAARWVAVTPSQPMGVEPALWRQWEDGSQALPAFVEEKLIDLLDFRLDAIEAATEPLDDEEEDEDDEEAPLVALWYGCLEDYTSLSGHEHVYWRPECSVVAELIATFGADVVTFDRTRYQAWLERQSGLQDTQETRASWALETVSAEED
ncbi:MAG: DUF1870 family protein [Burkholderiaceae bacterium]